MVDLADDATDTAALAKVPALADPMQQPEGGGESLFTLLFTSGSTGGPPKGVMVTADQFWIDMSDSHFEPLVGVSYIPLSHSSDRMRLWEFVCNGARVGYAFYDPSNWAAHEHGKKEHLVQSHGHSNNVEGLLAQIAALGPTSLPFPPRIWNGLHYLYHQRLREQGFATMPPGPARDAVQDKVRTQIAAMCGRRVTSMATGGAPTPDCVLEWIPTVWRDVGFVNSYGATEVGGITANGWPISKEQWRKGAIEVKLIDHPETGFTSDCSELRVERGVVGVGDWGIHICVCLYAEPNARGEVIVRSILTSKGYYNAPQLTAKAFDKDGTWVVRAERITCLTD